MSTGRLAGYGVKANLIYRRSRFTRLFLCNGPPWIALDKQMGQWNYNKLILYVFSVYFE